MAWFNGLVTLGNASEPQDYDAAIALFKGILDPQKQPRDRGFDFTKDYRVINQLGRALYERALKEGDDPAARDPFLLEAIDRYQSALRLESENVDTHYGLHQCFGELSSSLSKVKEPEKAPQTDEASLQDLTRILLDDKAERPARRQAAVQLSRAIALLGDEPVSATQPKRPRFELLLAQVGPYFQRETDTEVKLAEAQVLAALHLELWKIFKPDDHARNLAVQAHIAKHPAANHAAKAVVIYSLHRKGAPGF